MSRTAATDGSSSPGAAGASALVSQPGAERQRLAEQRAQGVPWWRWGPYLSERQWGTVREDYSPGGTAWDSFPHEHALAHLPLGRGHAKTHQTEVSVS